MAYLRWFVVVSLVLVAQAEGLAPAKNVHRAKLSMPSRTLQSKPMRPRRLPIKCRGARLTAPPMGASSIKHTQQRAISHFASTTQSLASPPYTVNRHTLRTLSTATTTRSMDRRWPRTLCRLPNQSTLSHRGMKPVDAAYLAIGRVLYTAELNLAYFSRADEGCLTKP